MICALFDICCLFVTFGAFSFVNVIYQLVVISD